MKFEVVEYLSESFPIYGKHFKPVNKQINKETITETMRKKTLIKSN